MMKHLYKKKSASTRTHFSRQNQGAIYQSNFHRFISQFQLAYIKLPIPCKIPVYKTKEPGFER